MLSSVSLLVTLPATMLMLVSVSSVLAVVSSMTTAYSADISVASCHTACGYARVDECVKCVGSGIEHDDSLTTLSSLLLLATLPAILLVLVSVSSVLAAELSMMTASQCFHLCRFLSHCLLLCSCW